MESKSTGDPSLFPDVPRFCYGVMVSSRGTFSCIGFSKVDLKSLNMTRVQFLKSALELKNVPLLNQVSTIENTGSLFKEVLVKMPATPSYEIYKYNAFNLMHFCNSFSSSLFSKPTTSPNPQRNSFYRVFQAIELPCKNI